MRPSQLEDAVRDTTSSLPSNNAHPSTCCQSQGPGWKHPLALCWPRQAHVRATLCMAVPRFFLRQLEVPSPSRLPRSLAKESLSPSVQSPSPSHAARVQAGWTFTKTSGKRASAKSCIFTSSTINDNWGFTKAISNRLQGPLRLSPLHSRAVGLVPARLLTSMKMHSVQQSKPFTKIGISQNYGYLFRGTYNKDYSILGSIFGYLNGGKVPNVCRHGPDHGCCRHGCSSRGVAVLIGGDSGRSGSSTVVAWVAVLVTMRGANKINIL